MSNRNEPQRLALERSEGTQRKREERLHQWQTEEITAAIAEADAGDFATNAEVQATFAKLIKVN